MNVVELAKQLQALDTSETGPAFWEIFNKMIGDHANTIWCQRPAVYIEERRRPEGDVGVAVVVAIQGQVELYSSSDGTMKIWRSAGGVHNTEVLADQKAARALWTETLENPTD